MNLDVRTGLYTTLENARGSGVIVTPHATTLLTILLESVEDDPLRLVPVKAEPQEVQLRALNVISETLPRLSKLYKTDTVNSVMILASMHRILAGFCPPFEYPPE